MIAFIKGYVNGIYSDRIVLESGNMGFNICMPDSDLRDLAGIGEEIKIYTYLSVREDALQLYGFLTKDELDFYKLLLGVNGIGPKAALAILSEMTTDDLRFAILSEDAKAISKAPGVGLKTAQRLIIDLKDKMSLEEAFEEKYNHTKMQEAANTLSNAKNEAALALSSLGYSQTDAFRAVSSSEIDDDDDVETVLKKALRIIALN